VTVGANGSSPRPRRTEIDRRAVCDDDVRSGVLADVGDGHPPAIDADSAGGSPRICDTDFGPRFDPA
jgi:hypothetical protein